MNVGQAIGCRIRETLPASLGVLDTFCERIRKVLQEEGVGSDLFAVELLLREALTNAILHGSQENPSKKVHCELGIQDDCVTIIVADEGEGFPWRAAMERELRPLSSSGRGMGILRKYATSIQFNEKGNRVELKRRLVKGHHHG